MTTKAFKVSSFTTVGHLLHINLKDHLLQHKHEVGKALLAKNPRAKAVVNKISSIDNTYRNFEIEVIAKRPDCEIPDDELMIVQVNENKCLFQLDFSKVYWNSRLSTEHERIVNKLNKTHDVVFDLFAGVGPFAVPAAKSKCKTYANDLNPESAKWLEVNMKRNKVQTSYYELFNVDAKEFILENLKPKLLYEYKFIKDGQWATKPKIHILMNLPALAPTFLPYFIGLFKNDSIKSEGYDQQELVELFKEQKIDHLVYCYCFLKGVYSDPKSEVKKMIEEQMGRGLDNNQLIDIFRVRNVAPYKEMYRVEIRLDENILFNQRSIMKSSNNHAPTLTTGTNGINKRVTIQAPKRKREESDNVLDTTTDDDSLQNDTKKTKYTGYCSIM